MPRPLRFAVQMMDLTDLGISRVVVSDAEQFAPIVAALAGR